MKRFGLGSVGLVTILLGVGCEGKTTTNEAESGLIACDPLATEHAQVLLGEVLGAGKSADGTVYVVDRVERKLRVLISDQDELVLQRESGSGEVSDDDGTLYLFMFSDREPELHVELHQSNDGTTRLGVLEGELPPGAKDFEIGAAGEELEPLSPADLKDFEVRADSVDTIVEYAATVADDQALVVLRPADLTSYEQFRVFFGPLDRLEERSQRDVQRARDGGSTSIDFEVDGQAARAWFPVVFENEMFTPGAPTFTLGDAALDIELLPSADAPDGGVYYCAK